MKLKRKAKNNLVQTLEEAQKIAFAPLTFKAIDTMIKTGIFEYLSKGEKSILDIMKKTGLSEYAVKLLMEVGEVSNIISENENKYKLLPLGEVFLYDEMTRVNFNFVNDVCYLGASELQNSFEKGEPCGLKKFIKDEETIYPILPKLPEQIKKSWYEFDNFYSTNCFDEIYEIMKKKNPKQFFDIGGNTGKFEKICLKNNEKVTMLDLAQNIEKAKKDKKLKACNFFEIDVLKGDFPKMEGAILMSQFLDCFSKEQILLILKKVKSVSKNGTLVYILEPFVDMQKFKGAKYSLVNTSLYFTCMANGCSKMYSKSEMLELAENTGLKHIETYEDIGFHNYTLLEFIV